MICLKSWVIIREGMRVKETTVYVTRTLGECIPPSRLNFYTVVLSTLPTLVAESLTSPMHSEMVVDNQN